MVRKVNFEIRVRDLKAVALFAAESDVRYVLLGVRLEINRDGLRLTASNGHILGTIRREVVMEGDDVDIIIPMPVIKSALAAVGKTQEWTALWIEYGDDDSRVYHLGNVGFPPDEGRYPDARRCWPQSVDGKPCFINPRYYALLDKAGKALGVKKPESVTRAWFDSSKAVFEINEELKILMMPLRMGDEMEEKSLPAW